MILHAIPCLMQDWDAAVNLFWQVAPATRSAGLAHGRGCHVVVLMRAQTVPSLCYHCFSVRIVTYGYCDGNPKWVQHLHGS